MFSKKECVFAVICGLISLMMICSIPFVGYLMAQSSARREVNKLERRIDKMEDFIAILSNGLITDSSERYHEHPIDNHKHKFISGRVVYE